MIPVAALGAFLAGATGTFPFGKAGADDEGELTLALAADHQHGILRLEFGKPVAWLGLPAKYARELAVTLQRKSRRARFQEDVNARHAPDRREPDDDRATTKTTSIWTRTGPGGPWTMRAKTKGG